METTIDEILLGFYGDILDCKGGLEVEQARVWVQFRIRIRIRVRERVDSPKMEIFKEKLNINTEEMHSENLLL